MRLFSLVTLATVFLAASAASALEFTVLSSTDVSVGIGEEFAIDIALTNNNGQGVAGITGTIEGGDAFRINSGESAVAHLNAVCLAPPTGCLGGVNTIDNVFFNPNDLSQGTNADDPRGTITIVNSLGLAASVNTGALDPGLDGGLTVPSERDVTIRLAGLSAGQYVLTIGGSFSDGAATLPIDGIATVNVTVIPEPGTALLMGLGMAGLAAAGRRRE